MSFATGQCIEDGGYLAGVWAHRVGAWTSSGPGYQHVFPIRGLDDLLHRLKLSPGLRGQVDRLGIVAHGDRDGVVRLEPTILNAFTVSRRLTEHFEKLRIYLTPRAFMSFESCIAGAGADGSALLTAVSRQLPGRTIVGYEVFGLIGREGLPNTPGRVQERTNALVDGGRRAFLTPSSIFAKWARDGNVIRWAMYGRDGSNHCGAPGCPGHAEAIHHCPPPPAP